MDKICRGSRVGEAHSQGDWSQGFSHADTTRTGRGACITTCSNKLENTEPRGGGGGGNPRGGYTSDTFRSQDWFKHDVAPPANNRVPELSPRFWQGAHALSPAHWPQDGQWGGSGKGSTSAGNLHNQPRSPRVVPPDADLRKPPRSMRNCQSDGNFSQWDENGRRTGGGGSPRAGGGDGSPRAARRAGSPTFDTSESWMGYSSPAGSPRIGQGDSVSGPITADKVRAITEELMPSRNFGSRARRQHSGRQVEAQMNGVIRQEREDGSPPPPPGPIYNGLDNRPSRGIRTHIAKNPDDMRRRLQLDESQTDNVRSQKQHAFTGPLRPPRPPVPSSARGGGSPRAPPNAEADIVVDMQHRTSSEMAASMAPGQAAEAKADDRKYLLGDALVSWNQPSRRTGPDCIKTSIPVACHVVDPVGGGPASYPVLRDHRNSDAIRDHLRAGPAPSAAFAPVSVPCVSSGPSATMTPAGLQLEGKIMSYGNHSAMPSTTSKDMAYEMYGLKTIKYGARQPGMYSPYVTRVPASQGIAC